LAPFIASPFAVFTAPEILVCEFAEIEISKSNKVQMVFMVDKLITPRKWIEVSVLQMLS
jgi:hypothetical protein